MGNIVSELQGIFEQNVISEFFLQQPDLLLRQAEAQQEELKSGLALLLGQQRQWTCDDILELCRDICPQWYEATPEKGWLEFTYWYIISWSYPESVFLEFPERFQPGMHFFMRVLRCALDYGAMHKTFDPFTDFSFLPLDTLPDHVIKEEYERFLYYFRKYYIYELMYIGKEIFFFNTLSHIAGVHYVAMHVARQLKEAGVPINLALVSGAAVGHDIGKFGCKPSEMKRMAHLHYYYTGQWFEEKNMPTIAHIAVNHSTWDLELENLPLESLVLIYADFRVRRDDAADAPREKMGIFTLKDSFHIILSKLENVDVAKERRYRYVYAKLKDFEDYMESLGVNTDFTRSTLTPTVPKHIALVDAQEAITNFKFLAIRHNIWMMEFLNTETSFGTLLEAARSEKDWKNTRAYIHIFEEYYTYMTQRQKIMTLNFLYELLMHREGDIRRQAATLMGHIILRYDEIYRKELPEDITLPVGQTTSLSLWHKYLSMIVIPDHKITERHKRWLGYTLKNMVTTVLENCPEQERYDYLDVLLYYYHEAHWDDEVGFILMDTLIAVPLELCEPFQIQELLDFTANILKRGNIELQAAALRFLEYGASFKGMLDGFHRQILAMLESLEIGKVPLGFHYNLRNIYQALGADSLSAALHMSEEEEQKAVSELFLENLKVATPWMLKLTNIDFLLKVAKHRAISLLQVATHLSNILKVGERISVRHRAGQGLVDIAPLLTLEERNELVIELTKGLEIGEYEFSKYIPEYLGQIALYLHPKELDEIVQDLQKLLRNANNRVVSVALNTLGVILEYYPAYQQRFGETDELIETRRSTILGMLLSGLSSYDEEVSSEAFIVLGHQLFGSKLLSLEEKNKIFFLIYKRMLILIHDKEMSGLAFFNRAGSLNHIYRFISDYLMEYEKFDVPELERVAFFPGTFDPFSSSHKGIVQEIRNLGFQVYLALDEFSWSKKTQPRMTRRQIITMSVADEENVYLFPDEIPINLANDSDMARLKGLFPDKEVYIVVGSDVILNASSYRKPAKPGSIHHFNHIVFRRVQGKEEEEAIAAEVEKQMEETVRNTIKGELIYLTLPTYLEDISSTRIRENIDCNRDISNLISPLAQNYIYHYGLYLREPQYKPILQAKNIKFDFVTEESSSEVYQLLVSFAQMDELMDMLSEHWQKPGATLAVLRDGSQNDGIVAFALTYTMETTDMYGMFHDAELVEWLRSRIFGKTMVLSGLYELHGHAVKNASQLLLTEVLAYYLEQDYGYALYWGEKAEGLEELLQRQGFLPVPLNQQEQGLYLVDMRRPLTLMKNIETTIKEPFNRNARLLAVVEQSHRRLQEAMTELYPGSLVLSIDAGIMHHKMLQKITRANHVPNEPLPVRKLGKNMCVPFGKILRGMVVPNTVTKTLHSEKVYDGDIKKFTIQNFPFYSTLENQVRTIKSFDRPVILVDDLLHKGHRIRGLEPILRQEQVQIDRMVVGILSARGKDLMAERACPVESAYFLPRLKGWYVESTLYPFIGGDMVARNEESDANLISSINFILPYVMPSYMKDVPREALYYFSLTCLENVHEILQVLEEEYQQHFGRRLTLGRLGEAIISPRCPDRGNCGSYDKNIAASVYVQDDIQRLVRLESIMAR